MYTMFFFFFQAEDGIRDVAVTGVQTCALPILAVATAACIKEGPHDFPASVDPDRSSGESARDIDRREVVGAQYVAVCARRTEETRRGAVAVDAHDVAATIESSVVLRDLFCAGKSDRGEFALS